MPVYAGSRFFPANSLARLNDSIHSGVVKSALPSTIRSGQKFGCFGRPTVISVMLARRFSALVGLAA
jgi:hypothetical protein